MTGSNAETARFVRDGLGEEVLHKIVNPNTRKLKYKKKAWLNNDFVKMLTQIYKTLGKMNG
jgi:hypothetical protein